MYPGIDMYQMMRRMYEELSSYKEQLIRLEQCVLQMEDAIKSLQDKATTHVEKIEYHFDQLKVEKLDGVLNIGISPQSSGAIESYSVGDESQQDLQFKPAAEMIYPQIRKRVYQYLDVEGPKEIETLEKKHNKTVGTEFRQVMIDDLRRQVDGRIQEYLRRKPAGEQQPGGEAVEEGVVNRLKRDIRTALDNYFKNLPNQGKDESDGA